jgi:hypothetical protein
MLLSGLVITCDFMRAVPTAIRGIVLLCKQCQETVYTVLGTDNFLRPAPGEFTDREM